MLAKDEIFALWYRVRDGTLARSTFRRHMRPLRWRVEGILEEGLRAECAKTRRTCARLLRHLPALWTFVNHEGIEPTNNIGERECVLTVHATLRQRGRSVHDFVVAACRAHMLGSRRPSLLAA